MISILSNSFRTATRTDHRTDGQRPTFRDERKVQNDSQARAEKELRRWHRKWFAG